MRGVVAYVVNVISPEHISSAMLKRAKYSLNQISHDSAIFLIRSALDAGIDVKEVWVLNFTTSVLKLVRNCRALLLSTSFQKALFIE